MENELKERLQELVKILKVYNDIVKNLNNFCNKHKTNLSEKEYKKIFGKLEKLLKEYDKIKLDLFNNLVEVSKDIKKGFINKNTIKLIDKSLKSFQRLNKLIFEIERSSIESIRRLYKI